MSPKLRRVLSYIGYYLFAFFFTYRMFLTAIGGRVDVPIAHTVGATAILSGTAVYFVVQFPDPERQPITAEKQWGEPGLAAGNKRSWFEIGGILRTLLLITIVIVFGGIVVWALTFLEVRPPAKY